MYALTGRLYDSAKQYRRAAHYYKLQIMSNAGGSHTPNEVAALMCLAAAYDWDSLVTGPLVDMVVAGARQHRLLNMWLCTSTLAGLAFTSCLFRRTSCFTA